MLTEKSSVEEVQDWFKTYRNGKFLKYIELFAEAHGKDMLGFSKEDLKEIIGPAQGIALYNILHAQAPTGTP